MKSRTATKLDNATETMNDTTRNPARDSQGDAARAETQPAHRGRRHAHAAMNAERRMRADIYSILSALLGGTPAREFLDSLARMNIAHGGGDDEVTHAWRELRESAAATSAALLDDEYHELFTGRERARVVPFGSWYLSGFLMEQPLEELRGDLYALGVTPCARPADAEDHIAALCESMALIIAADGIDAARERRFFARHLLPWAGQFFTDLQSATSARFYQPVGVIGRRFIESEREYLNIGAHFQTH